jgi:peptidoglycan hydrolase CwlO-like protein
MPAQYRHESTFHPRNEARANWEILQAELSMDKMQKQHNLETLLKRKAEIKERLQVANATIKRYRGKLDEAQEELKGVQKAAIECDGDIVKAKERVKSAEEAYMSHVSHNKSPSRSNVTTEMNE